MRRKRMRTLTRPTKTRWRTNTYFIWRKVTSGDELVILHRVAHACFRELEGGPGQTHAAWRSKQFPRRPPRAKHALLLSQ